jgi:F0F1-type ATP synthase epsilon subunit
MAFAAGLFKKQDDGLAKTIAAQNAERARQADEANQAQARLIADERAKTQQVEAAQRRVRLGRGRGLLRFTDSSSEVLGSSAA